MRNLRQIRVGVLAVGTMLAAGCLQIESTLDIEADGGGKWRLQYAMPTHIIRQMNAARDLAAELAAAGGAATNRAVQPQNIPMIFDEAEIKARFAPLAAQEVRLSKLQVREHGGWQHVDLTVRFTRLESLLNAPFFSLCAFSFSRAGDNTCKLVAEPPRLGGELPDLSDAEVLKRIIPFLNGTRIVCRIGVPGDIRNSNSYLSDIRRATWEWDFDKDSRVIERLDREKMIVVFDGNGVRLRDFEKPAAKGAETGSSPFEGVERK